MGQHHACNFGFSNPCSAGREKSLTTVSTACIQQRDVHALGLQLYLCQRRHGGVRATQHHFPHKIQETDFSNQEFTSMTTSKRPTGGGSRQISLRLYVYTSTLTQCTFDSPTSHSFHGSNSSSSKDNGLVVFWCSIKYKLIALAQIGWSNVQYSKLRNKVCCPIEVLSCPGLDKRQLRKREIEHDFGDIR